MVCSRSGVRLYADTRCYVYTYLVRIPFLFDFPFDEIYRRLLLFTLTRYVCMYNTCRCTMNSTSVSLFVRSLVGGGTHDTYVPPVDAHVWRQLHLSAVARCSDSYCIFFYFTAYYCILGIVSVLVCFLSLLSLSVFLGCWGVYVVLPVRSHVIALPNVLTVRVVHGDLLSLVS